MSVIQPLRSHNKFPIFLQSIHQLSQRPSTNKHAFPTAVQPRVTGPCPGLFSKSRLESGASWLPHTSQANRYALQSKCSNKLRIWQRSNSALQPSFPKSKHLIARKLPNCDAPTAMHLSGDLGPPEMSRQDHGVFTSNMKQNLRRCGTQASMILCHSSAVFTQFPYFSTGCHPNFSCIRSTFSFHSLYSATKIADLGGIDTRAVNQLLGRQNALSSHPSPNLRARTGAFSSTTPPHTPYFHIVRKQQLAS